MLILFLKDEWPVLPSPDYCPSLVGGQDKAQGQKRAKEKVQSGEETHPGDNCVHSQDESRIKAMGTKQ